eukprot:m.1355892 g.1355892  ORF g.1355892 m.1355892 type:complete len:284 (+) comp24933_c0_seq26:3774-4625(+)
MVYPISVMVPMLSDDVASRCLQPPGAGILRVTLISASHLKNTDTFSKSDPACFLTLHDDTTPVTKLSSMISNNLNPVWNESFEYVVQKACTKFAFQVYDIDGHLSLTSKAKTLLGSCEFFVGDLPADTPFEETLPLHIRDKQRGQLRYRAEWKPFGSLLQHRSEVLALQKSCESVAVMYCKIVSTESLPIQATSIRGVLGGSSCTKKVHIRTLHPRSQCSHGPQDCYVVVCVCLTQLLSDGHVVCVIGATSMYTPRYTIAEGVLEFSVGTIDDTNVAYTCASV